MAGPVSLSRKTSAVNIDGFLDLLVSLLCKEEGRTAVVRRDVRNYGIAVSGGCDSMALAFLCHQYRRLYRIGDPKMNFLALVVDHQLRKNSHIEVARTQDRLIKMGLETHVIKLEWPPGILHSKLPYFETKARSLRYQAIGNACVQNGLEKVLLGHHADDQAENVLMSLAASLKPGTIRTMKTSATIPECEGIHGIDHSGMFDRAAAKFARTAQLLSNPEYRHSEEFDVLDYLWWRDTLKEGPPLFESGGVDICRPLLTFPKERLRQTCIDNSVEWEEDETNHDVGITTRNTVRSLLSNGRLPRALQTPSLLRLANRKDENDNKAKEMGNTMLENCEVLEFDARSGVLVVRLQPNALPHEPSKSFARSVATHFLHKIACPVTSQQNLSLASLYTAVSMLFLDLRDPHTTQKNFDDKVMSFTAGGVHFLRERMKRTQDDSSNSRERENAGSLDPEYVWVLSRQPFSETSRPEPLTFFSRDDKYNNWLRSEWHLWDGRYWIQIRHPANHKFVLRSWKEHEMSALKARLKPRAYDKFRDILKEAAPGKIRWTLPVIAEVENSAIEGDTIERDPLGRIVVFPTLGKAGWLDILNEFGDRKLEWDVRYKKISLRRRDNVMQVHDYDLKVVSGWDDGGRGEPNPIQGFWVGK